MQTVLLAGISGYLGGYVAQELLKRDFAVRAIIRDKTRLRTKSIGCCRIIEAELTQPETIVGCCSNMDIVISTIGITKHKDGLTYMDVDYQANLNLLREAQRSGVKKFVYISVLNGNRLRNLKICDAKERFVDQLKQSEMDYCIVRPNGFFSDISEIYKMARQGRVYLFGKGQCKANPIHGKDLAAVCVDATQKPIKEIDVGGPETLTHNEIALTAFDVLGTVPRITHIPDWMRTSFLKMARLFTGSKTYGPIEFFLTVMSMDMMATEYGGYTLREYFTRLKQMTA